MIHQGLHSCANMDDLSVMGITEVLLKLPRILTIRNRLVKNILEAKPCVYIGIDLPDFNLYIEQKAKNGGIPTVHYVSPSVWAWREGRITKIKSACDEVLALGRSDTLNQSVGLESREMLFNGLCRYTYSFSKSDCT